jgi:hypothetical protein
MTVTKQEHLLMMGMMAGLFQVSTTLIEILISREIATADDFPPFSALVSDSKAIERFADFYRGKAASLGLNTP